MRFIRDNASILRKRYTLIAPEGTYKTIIKTGYFEEGKHIISLPPGAHGGILEVAYRVVTGQCGVVIFLYDPEEIRSESPETRALTRVCIHKQVALLTTVATADYWLKYQSQDYEPPRELDWLRGREGEAGSYHELGPEHSTIALIAHDVKKKGMQKFVERYVDFLNKFKRIIATGTTGALIKGWFYEFPDLADRVVLADSGPEGGDVQIAHEILSQRCHVVIFLHDPLTAHPHDSDISLLRRTCQLPGISVILLSDVQSAEAWVESASSPPKQTLAERVRNRFKLKEVLVIPEDMVNEPLKCLTNIPSEKQGWGRSDKDWSRHKKAWEEVIFKLCGVAARYVDVILRQEREEKIWIAANLGRTMNILARAIEEMKPLPICGLTVKAMIGIPGVIRSEYSANTIAERIAKTYGGKSSLSEYEFFTTGADPLSPAQRQELLRTRIVLTSIGPIPKHRAYSKEVDLVQDRVVDQEVINLAVRNGAVGAIGGILINEHGQEVLTRYRPVGLQYSDLAKIAQRGQVVLVVGGDERRYPAIKAALRAELCSVLITEPETAQELLLS
jgi:methylglyoxal synthase